ncbi:MAG: hypothetical protein DDT26_01626 [Dehalococcoidia bacterium]|nr:hypothetical protein [Chloroflexota bacterium]
MDIPGEEAVELVASPLSYQGRKFASHIPTNTQFSVAFFDSPYLLDCEQVLDGSGFLVSPIFHYRSHDDLAQGYALELSSDNIEYLV